MKIQILLATYNGEKYLSQQIKSVLDQEIPENSSLEILLSDDSSTDNTIDIAKSFNSKKIRILDTTRKGGAKQNFNYLISQADADYILLCDQDDVWLPGKIKKSVEAVINIESAQGNEKPALVFTDAIVANSSLNEINNSFWRHENLNPRRAHQVNQLFVQNVGQGATMAFNKALLNKVASIPNEAIMHDWWLILTASTFGRVQFLRARTLLYRQHENNEVGARKNSLLEQIKSSIKDPRNPRDRIRSSIVQATAFLKIFGDDIPPKTLSFLQSYTCLYKANPIKRLAFLASQRITKTTALKTIGFYILVATPISTSKIH